MMGMKIRMEMGFKFLRQKVNGNEQELMEVRKRTE